jgi:hypothetical protein
MITLNEVDYIKELNNPYLFPMPIDSDGTDLISTAEKFIVKSKVSFTLDVNADGSVTRNVVQPDIVTLIPGHSWNHISGDAHTETKSPLQRMIQMSPLIAYLFNFAANPVIRKMIMEQLDFFN